MKDQLYIVLKYWKTRLTFSWLQLIWYLLRLSVLIRATMTRSSARNQHIQPLLGLNVLHHVDIFQPEPTLYIWCSTLQNLYGVQAQTPLITDIALVQPGRNLVCSMNTTLFFCEVFFCWAAERVSLGSKHDPAPELLARRCASTWLHGWSHASQSQSRGLKAATFLCQLRFRGFCVWPGLTEPASEERVSLPPCRCER